MNKKEGSEFVKSKEFFEEFIAVAKEFDAGSGKIATPATDFSVWKDDTEIFDPNGDDERYVKLMRRARKVNFERDEIERKAGLATPADGDLSSFLRNAISAFSAGLSGRDWTCVAEGLDMLQQAEVRARKLPN